ncbi:uncharacterized protein BDZ99DRAFT_476432 [Mytilinidion resinicola]|uniref:Uncharacterized protein n=1 Tax=Mytilinidion resinicola TaxID=574789 RepID=A0A6A6YNW3_9PEZI|nr:uncharacterized protein BDZ99DRAFT_476432 [Mytilinidion resinicola]KAF2810249.1 hypothetical protein BDZ99DRAFT_476432 [Mytilinidion resinicola]
MKCSGPAVLLLSSCALALHPGVERRSLDEASMSALYYIVSIKGALATGGNDYTGSETAPLIPIETGDTTGTAATGTATPANAPKSTKSQGVAAATSSPFAAGLGGAMGILGLAIALQSYASN